MQKNNTPASRLAALWDDLATEHEFSLHGGFGSQGEIVFLVIPAVARLRAPKPKELREAFQASLSRADVKEFIRLSPCELEHEISWNLPGLSKSVPLPAPHALGSWLSDLWNEESERWIAQKGVLTRLHGLARTPVRCVLKADGLRLPSVAVAADLLGALAEVSPDTLTPPTLALADALVSLRERITRALSENRWLVCGQEEGLLFSEFRAAASASWVGERSSKSLGLFRKREERAAYLAVHCLSETPAQRIPGLDSLEQDPAEAVRSGRLHDLPPFAPLMLPHVETGPLLSLAGKVERILESSPVGPHPSFRYSGYPLYAEQGSARSRDRDQRWALAWQIVLCGLLEESRVLTTPSHAAAFPLSERLKALEVRQEESLVPEIASWMIPAETPPLRCAVLDNGTEWSIACLHPAFASGAVATRRKALLEVPERHFLSAARALSLGHEAFRRECRSTTARTLPWVAEQVVGVYLRTLRALPATFGTLSFCANGTAEPDAESLERDKLDMAPLHYGDILRLEELEGACRFQPRSFGERPGLLLNVADFPLRAAEIPVLLAIPEKRVDVVLAFRPKHGSETLLRSLTASPEALRAALSALASKGGEGGESFFSDLELEPVFRFEVEGRTVLEEDWLQAKRRQNVFVLPDGTTLDAKSYERCLAVYLLRRKSLARFGRLTLADVWKVSRTEAPRGGERFSTQDYLRTLQVKLEGLEDLLGAPLVEGFLQASRAQRPQATKHVLRPYQEWGVAWILSRFTLGLGACLADDMGLGKTLQTIETIRALRAGRDPHRVEPSSAAEKPVKKKAAIQAPLARILIVCPKTLLLNWMSEWARFAPEVTVALADGPDFPTDASVVVTSYSRLRMNAERFASEDWLCVVLDEAHQIKNPETAQAQAVRALNSRFRLALTGTPLENHARELWSLVDWMNGGWLGPCGAFESYTRLARTREEKDLMLAPVRSLLGPVLLRRMKADPAVALDLPPKIETVLEVDLSEEQAVLYETVVLAALGAGSQGETAFARSSRFLKAILHCKQICGHPDLFLRGDEDDAVLAEGQDLSPYLRKRLHSLMRAQADHRAPLHERSSKLLAFRERLLSLQEAQGGVLIFTQSLGAGALIQSVLAESGVPTWDDVPFLTGALSSQQRAGLVESFQSACTQRSTRAAPPVLLVSLKAGGLGLNLTGAEHVLHFDRWWNPAAEDQATDRAHRIGQTKTVQVHHFLTRCTIEKGIARMIENKRALAADLLGAAGTEDVGSLLANEEGFLSLVDPDERFVSRRGVSR